MPTLTSAWHVVKYSRAARVRTRQELDAALARAPGYVVIEGSESLRAYAASLAYRGGQEAAKLEVADAGRDTPPDYLMVPTVGRIRDGYRQRQPVRRTGRRGRGTRLGMQAGLGTVVAACCGLAAALMLEWLLWPASDPELVRGRHGAAVHPLPRGQVLPLPTRAPPLPAATLDQELHAALLVVLGLVALATMGFLLWQAAGPGRPARVSWRVDHRVQGRLVIARVLTRVA